MPGMEPTLFSVFRALRVSSDPNCTHTEGLANHNTGRTVGPDPKGTEPGGRELATEVGLEKLKFQPLPIPSQSCRVGSWPGKPHHVHHLGLRLDRDNY
jgi:hypothetical protein